MQKRKIKRLDQSATNGQEKARMTENTGRKRYLKKSGKESSQPRRRGNERASDGKKQRGGQRRPVFKLADFLSEEIIEKLRGIKEAEKENGRTNLKQ